METKKEEVMDARHWEIHHHESQLLKNLRTSMDQVSVVTASKTTTGMFLIAVDGTMSGPIANKTWAIPWSGGLVIRLKRTTRGVGK